MNKGSNPTAVLKHYLEKGKITEQETASYVEDWFKNLDKNYNEKYKEFLLVELFKFNCENMSDLIKKALPEHILERYNWNHREKAKAKRQVKKIKELAKKTKNKQHTERMNYVLNHQANYNRDKIAFFYEEIGSNDVDLSLVLSPLRSKKQRRKVNRELLPGIKDKIDRVNEKLYEKYGHNYEFIVHADKSTVNRNLVLYYGLLKYAKSKIPFWGNDPNLKQSKRDLEKKFYLTREEGDLRDKLKDPKYWYQPPKAKNGKKSGWMSQNIDTFDKKSDWKRENIDTYLTGKDPDSRQYVDVENNESVRSDEHKERITARQEETKLRKEKLFRDILNGNIKVPTWVHLQVWLFGVDGLDGLIDLDKKEPGK